jgi:hypothetical protein
MTRVTPVHPGNRIELPEEWAAEFGLGQYAALEKTSEGILVHRCPSADWDGVFVHKLQIRSSTESSDAVEVNGDAVLF